MQKSTTTSCLSKSESKLKAKAAQMPLEKLNIASVPRTKDKIPKIPKRSNIAVLINQIQVRIVHGKHQVLIQL